MRRGPGHALAVAAYALALGWAGLAGAEPESSSTAKPKICVVTPDVQFGQGVNASTDPAARVTATLITYLSGPAADVVALRSRVPLQVNAEATQQGCSHIIDLTVTYKKAGKGMKTLLAAAPGLASAIPFVGGVGGLAASAVASVAAETMAASQAEDFEDDWMDDMRNVSQVNIKKGDVITLKFDLRRPTDTEPMATSQLETKAAANGEDILSPLIEKTATQVLSVILGTTGEVRSDFETEGGEEKRKTRTHSEGES